MGKKLKDLLPLEFMGCEYDDSKARQFSENLIVKEFKDTRSGEKWPGPQKNVYCWVILDNNHAVGWNENPATGWSFPVVKLNKVQQQNMVFNA